MAGMVGAVWDATKELMDDGCRVCRFTGRIVGKILTSRIIKSMFFWGAVNSFVMTALLAYFGYTVISNFKSIKTPVEQSVVEEANKAAPTAGQLRIEGKTYDIQERGDSYVHYARGAIVNNTPHTIWNVSVEIAFLGPNSEVYGIGRAYPIGALGELRPGEKAYYEVVKYGLPRKAYSYDIRAKAMPTL